MAAIFFFFAQKVKYILKIQTSLLGLILCSNYLWKQKPNKPMYNISTIKHRSGSHDLLASKDKGKDLP